MEKRNQKERASTARKKKKEGSKGTGRRLYTDENPKDTVSIKYATVEDARKTANKVKKINKPFARKIQILTVMEQRAKVSGKIKQAQIAKAAKQFLRTQEKKVG